MPTSSNSAVVANAKGVREDLRETIVNLSPTKTPILSLLDDAPATNTLFTWLGDKQPSVNVDNAQSDSFDFTSTLAPPATQYQNYTQIFTKDAKVSNSLEAVKTAGRKSQISYEMVKAGKAIKTDVETIILGKQPASNGDPRRTRAMEHLLARNDFSNHGVGFAGATTETQVITDETTKRPFTETLLNVAKNAAWDGGCEPNRMFMNLYNKTVFNGFAGRTASRVAVDADTITNHVDYYLSDTGELHVQAIRNIRGNTVLLLDSEHARMRWLRDYRMVEVPPTFDGVAKRIIAEGGLEVDPAGSFVITGVFASAAEAGV